MELFSISVVILATDESVSLTQTVDYINNKCVEKIDKTIIVLSRNASYECVIASQELKEKYKNRVDITVQEEDGLGAAACHGADMVKTTHMTFFPADRAIELECLDRMIAVAKSNPEKVVKSSRWLKKGNFINYSKPKLVLNYIAQSFLRFLFVVNLTDLTNPVQVIPTEYEKTINWSEKGVCALIEHTIVPVRLGYPCVEVPAKCFPRTEGQSKNSWLQTALYLKTALRVRLTSKKKFYIDKQH